MECVQALVAESCTSTNLCEVAVRRQRVLAAVLAVVHVQLLRLDRRRVVAAEGECRALRHGGGSAQPGRAACRRVSAAGNRAAAGVCACRLHRVDDARGSGCVRTWPLAAVTSSCDVAALVAERHQRRGGSRRCRSPPGTLQQSQLNKQAASQGRAVLRLLFAPSAEFDAKVEM